MRTTLNATQRDALTCAETLQDVLGTLEALDDLGPSPHVDATFGRLVRTVVETPERLADAVLDRLEPARFRRISGLGEHALETAWAERIRSGTRLAAFPYRDNYEHLSALEAGLLRRAGPASSVAFLGAGPLPLSAVLLARRLGAAVTGLDRDAAAVADARAITPHLLAQRPPRARGAGYDRATVTFERADAYDADLTAYDTVVVAALVGESADDKRRLLDHLAAATRPGAVVLVRSARALRTLLYPAVPLDALRGFEVLDVVHPTDDVINSVVVARRKPSR